MLYGVLNLSIWQYVVITLVLTHLTAISITIYLHRSQAHRALDLHPIASHFFRFWLWLTTGMRTNEWVAVHRKHHAFSDKPGDPHSPKVFGIKKVLLEGAELYSAECLNQDTLNRYSHGTPKDWIERHLYQPYSYLGISLMLVIDLILFGLPGISIWAIQMLWTPLLAAGIINGIGHFFGYRNFECDDAARNIVPIGIIIAGEELHNNHHTFGSSAKLSYKWWEFDIGWLYIRILSFFKLAKVKKLPAKLTVKTGKSIIDLDTLKAIINNRFQIMNHYCKHVMLPVFHEEKRNADKSKQATLRKAKKLFVRETNLIDQVGQHRLTNILNSQKRLNVVYQYRVKLQEIWNRTTATHKELMDALHEWCHQAEATGVEVLQHFAQRLKGYSVAPVATK